jgi:hypothetical protein
MQLPALVSHGTPASSRNALRLWSHLDDQRAYVIALNIVLLIGTGLWLEAQFGYAGQQITNLWAIALLLWCAREGRREERIALFLAIALSAIGEISMSPLLGLYEYRYHTVPVFVPPGHALVMTLGVLIDQRLARHARTIIVAVAALAALWAGNAWIADSDRLGVLLFALFAYLLLRGPSRSLYAVMFVLALGLELYGTAIHAWAWAPHVPYAGISAANPPFAAGAFYCSLDLVVLGLLRRYLMQSRATPAHVQGLTTTGGG